MTNLDNAPSCPICGSYEVQQTRQPDLDGFCEYHCDSCGQYFVAEAIEESEESNDD